MSYRPAQAKLKACVYITERTHPSQSLALEKKTRKQPRLLCARRRGGRGRGQDGERLRRQQRRRRQKLHEELPNSLLYVHLFSRNTMKPPAGRGSSQAYHSVHLRSVWPDLKRPLISTPTVSIAAPSHHSGPSIAPPAPPHPTPAQLDTFTSTMTLCGRIPLNLAP